MPPAAPGEELPPPHDDIDIGRAELETVVARQCEASRRDGR